MAPVPLSSVLVLTSTGPSLCSPLTAAQASAASALGCVAALVRAAALTLAAGSPGRRRVAAAARCTRRRSWRLCCFRRRSRSPRPDPRCAMHAASLMAPVMRSSALVLSSTRPSLCPPLTAARASAASALGARLYRRARSRGGALARRRLAMLAAARARCATHTASPMAPVLRSSVLALSSTRLSICSPLTADRTARPPGSVTGGGSFRPVRRPHRTPHAPRVAATQRPPQSAAASRSLQACAPTATHGAQHTTHAAHCAPSASRADRTAILRAVCSSHAHTHSHYRPAATQRPPKHATASHSRPARAPTAPHAAIHRLTLASAPSRGAAVPSTPSLPHARSALRHPRTQ